ncbi:MAG: DUF4926 domain-containing protein, partial [Acaryochloris sp. CRU_2_0]|nr:DUF4926 domain-containing protein [Acaryochloris sp. CRU_2_0]
MKLLDIVALLQDLPELGLYRGNVGTIVEEYEPGVFEVEFSDTSGKAYAIETLKSSQLMTLHHHPIEPQKLPLLRNTPNASSSKPGIDCLRNLYNF